MNQVEKTAKVLYEGLTGEKWQGLNALQKLDCLIPLEQLVKAERERILGLTEGIMRISPAQDKLIVNIKDWAEFKEEVNK